MELMEAIKNRHSVRAYLNAPIEDDIKAELNALIDECNKEGGLHIQLITDEPKAFDCRMARYGHFYGVKNYVVFVGKKCDNLDEKCGYYGEKILLRAQQLGLNSCWVGLSYKKNPEAYEICDGEKLVLVAAIGYGANQGKEHKIKSFDEVTSVEGEVPEWFKNGVEAALLAPTAINQQKFKFVLKGDTVTAKCGFGPYAKLDLGIVKYHFEVGAGKDNFRWA